MKRFLQSIGITGIATLLAITAPVMKSAAQIYDDDQYIDYNNDYNGTYQDFYNSLSPYGQWIQDPQYGYVWLPDAGPDFRPYYTNGRWVMTEYGNTWISDYPWGWAPFHYGRWTYSSYYGWIWIPGSQWGPAWVSWRSSADYYGWAPLGPGITVSFSFGSGYSCPMDWWVFIPGNYIYSPRFQTYYRGPRYNQTYINRTTIINNTYINNSTHTTYVTGPRASEIQRITRQPVHVYQVQNMNRIGASAVSGNAVSFYRPQIRQAATGGNTRPRPQQAVRPQQTIGRPAAVSSSNGTPVGRQELLNNRSNPGRAPQNNNRTPQATPWNSRQQGTPVQTRPAQPDRNWQQQQAAPQPVRQAPQQQPQPQRNWQQPAPQQSQPQRNWQQPRPQQQPQPEPVRQAPPQRMEAPRPQQPQPQPQQPQPQRNWQQPRPQPAPQQQPVRQAPPQRMEAPRPQPAPEPARQAPPQQRENPMRR